MLYRWRIRRKTARFNQLTREILNTKPLSVTEGPWTIASMVANDDVQMYLLALKSFYARIGRGKIVAIIDGDMPNQLRYVLQQHIHGIELQVLEDIETGPCQRGGTWERLVYLLERSHQEYVIQLDADVLTIGPLDEVCACIASNRAFTMGTSDGLRTLPVAEASAYAEGIDSDHIQILAERALSKLPGSADLRYVRGSSGFAGFARGGFGRRKIEEFHVKMARLLGDRFCEWGTEQVASNFAIANTADPVVLPYPDYAIFGPRLDASKARLLHFIGSYRFDDDTYARLGRQVVDSMLQNEV
jgi:hypothetical protein